jgi:hypothetical protein
VSGYFPKKLYNRLINSKMRTYVLADNKLAENAG